MSADTKCPCYCCGKPTKDYNADPYHSQSCYDGKPIIWNNVCQDCSEVNSTYVNTEGHAYADHWIGMPMIQQLRLHKLGNKAPSKVEQLNGSSNSDLQPVFPEAPCRQCGK